MLIQTRAESFILHDKEAENKVMFGREIDLFRVCDHLMSLF